MKKLIPVLALCAALSAFADDDDNWPQWRGPSLDGTSGSKGLPLKWSGSKNVKWKVKLPAWSGSTPAIWGDKIFLLSSDGEEAPIKRRFGGRRPTVKKTIYLFCFSKKDGKRLWRTRLCGGNYITGKQDLSSPSPITDGKSVWTMTGSGIVTALDMDGKVIWSIDLQKKYGKFGQGWGYGASPLLFEGKLIVPVLHGMRTDKPSYLVALNPKDGKVAWKVNRPTDARTESPDAFNTPVPMKIGDSTQVIISGGDFVSGHDPKTGKEIWRCYGLNPTNNPYYRTVASPLVVGNMVFACTKKGPMMACRAGGKGDVTKTHSLWTSQLYYDVPTPVSDGKYVYVLNDRGRISCLDPKTGKAHYENERLPRGIYDASPLLADGRIYCTNEKGKTTVIKAGPKFEILAENSLNDVYTLSSIAVSGKELFIRTSSHLYCISEEK